MNKELMTPAQRSMRINVRNFLMVATLSELERELELALDMAHSQRAGSTACVANEFRAECVRELIAEWHAESAR